MNRSIILPALAAATFAVTASAVAWMVDGVVRDRFVEQARSNLLALLSGKRAKLESALSARSQLAQGLVPYELSAGPLSSEQFQSFARSLLQQRQGIEAIALIRANGQHLSYPRETNPAPMLEAYRQQRQRFPTAIPNGLLTRRPLPYTSRSSYFTYAAICDGRCSVRRPAQGTVVLMFDELALLADADLLNQSSEIHYALREESAKDSYQVLFGLADTFERDPVVLSIPLLKGQWQLAAAPAAGWGAGLLPVTWLRVGGAIGILLGTGLTFLLVRQPLCLRVAIEQTSQSNRLLREEILERQLAESKLQALAEKLEQRVSERTQALSNTLDTLKRTQVQVVQAEKMSSLGQLVAGVAHEINNPVSFIYGNLSHARDYIRDLLSFVALLHQEYPQLPPKLAAGAAAIDLKFLEDDLPKLLSSMEAGAERIQGIVRSLRVFSRLDESDLKVVDLHDGIDSALTILNHRLKAIEGDRTVQVDRQYAANLPMIECYAGQLNQVFMNLLVNAIDALEDHATQRDCRIVISTVATDRHTVCISIHDNGPGMDESVRSRIFDAFFTTKEVGKGTGMGLSIAYQVITERHQGSLTCQTAPRQGTTFTIEIPLTQSLAAPMPQPIEAMDKTQTSNQLTEISETALTDR
ncbi:MAG: GHKL domain-containing protein [Oscillatoriales cyanobacterium]|nr:MAG: GHKL domain-containing protein [Oscillatoriales cyanobacterium]